MLFKWSPIKNIDFIIDYYSVLELEQFSNNNFKKQFHKLSKQNHPDTVNTASEEIKKLADKKFRLIQEAYTVLSDEKNKNIYDKQLEKFIKEKPNLISTDGTPIVSLQQESLSLDFLLSGADCFDFQELQSSKANTLIGFNQTTLDALENLYKLNPNDEKIKEAYLDQLNRQKMVTDWAETFAWQELGVLNPKEVSCQHSDEYLELIEQKINSIEHSFNNLAEVRLIGCSVQPLQIENHTTINNSTDQSNLSIIKKELNAKINKRKEKLIKISKDKQDLLKKVVKVRTYKKIHSTNSQNISVLLYNNENKIILNFIVDLEIDQELKIKTDYNGLDISEYNDLSRNTYALKHNIELDMAFQVIEFVNDLANKELDHESMG